MAHVPWGSPVAPSHWNPTVDPPPGGPTVACNLTMSVDSDTVGQGGMSPHKSDDLTHLGGGGGRGLAHCLRAGRGCPPFSCWRLVR